jgi:acetyl esterase/lipase
LTDVAYGTDPRQVIDVWKAETASPSPVMLYVHGGSWIGGTKSTVRGVPQALAAGISVVSVEYRRVGQAERAGVQPPVAWPMHDVARALQFVRSRAGEWHLDKTRVCISGNSAGACAGLWVAFHDDMADPASPDPVARESTRVSCAAMISAQTSLDPAQMKAWTPNMDYGAHAFGIDVDKARGLSRFGTFLAARERLLPWIREYSPWEWVTADDPPVFLSYATRPAMGRPQLFPAHSANFGVGLRNKLRSVGIETHLVYPGSPDVAFRHPHEFVIARLTQR